MFLLQHRALEAFLPPRISPNKNFHFLKIAQNDHTLASSTGRDGQLTGRLEQPKTLPLVSACLLLLQCSEPDSSNAGKTGSFFPSQKLHFKEYSKRFSASARELRVSTLCLDVASLLRSLSCSTRSQ